MITRYPFLCGFALSLLGGAMVAAAFLAVSVGYLPSALFEGRSSLAGSAVVLLLPGAAGIASAFRADPSGRPWRVVAGVVVGAAIMVVLAVILIGIAVGMAMPRHD